MLLIERDQKHGMVEVEVEDSDDLWHLYNIVDSGDRVCGYTMREIKVSRGTGEERAGRRRVYLCISVEELSFQTFTDRLRIKGKVVHAPEELNIQGSYHSFSVGVRDRLKILKEEWLSFHNERLAASLSKERPKALIVTLDDQDALIYSMRDYDVREALSIKSGITGKYADSDRPAAKSEYFAEIAAALSRMLQKEKAEVVVAGPGFTKNDLAKYLRERLRMKVVEDSTSSVGEPAVRELMNRGTIQRLMESSALVRDTRLIDELLSRLSRSPGLAAYGAEEVKRAVEGGAVETLLLSERLFKSAEPAERRAIEDLCKKTERYGGKVYFIGGEHEKGRQLVGLGGIAALLRYAVHQIG